MSSPAKAVGIGLVGALAGLAGLFAASLYFEPDTPDGIDMASGVILPSPRAIPDFALTGSEGQKVGKELFRGQWSLVFVGFTHCPDVCPNTLALLKGVKKDLGENAKNLQVVFLSVDPERDKPEALGKYVTYFDPDFVGVTGEKKELDALGRAMGFVYLKAPGATADTYNIDHSTALILVNPQAQLAGYLTAPHKREAMTADLRDLLRMQAS